MTLEIIVFGMSIVMASVAFFIGKSFTSQKSTTWTNWEDVGIKYNDSKQSVYMLQTRCCTSGERQFRKIPIDKNNNPDQFMADKYKPYYPEKYRS